MNPPLIGIPRTLALLKQCWNAAELRVCESVSQHFHAHDEVFITRLLHGKLHEEFEKKNSSKQFETELRGDLTEAFQKDGVGRDEIQRVATGVVARVTYHEPHVERKSGGDLGLMVCRPQVSRHIIRQYLSCRLHRQGLLCQGKREHRDGSLGELTKNQRKVLPERHS